MQDKICLITGANSGIGKATAQALASKGATVVMVCRSLERGEAARAEVAQASGNDRVILLRADVGSKADIAHMAQAFRARFDRLDVLVNNAGLYLPTRSTTIDGFESMFGINHLGYYLVANFLADSLRASPAARVVNVSSGAHSIGKIDFNNLNCEHSFSAFKQYGNTKLANILFTRALAKRLPPGSTANCLHPGVVATEFAQDQPGFVGTLAKLGRLFLLSPEKGARTQIYLASSPEVANITGAFFIRCKQRKPSKTALDDALAERLWTHTASLTGIDAFPSPT